MKRRRLIVLASLVVLGVFAWVLLRPHEPPEPVYKGKSLSYWLRGFNPFSSLGSSGFSAPTFQDSLDAFKSADTNAIPLLLDWLRAKDSPLPLKFVHLAQRQRLINVNFMPAADRNSAAAWGFTYLVGPRKHIPTNAIPALIHIYNENISESSQLCTAFALGSFGPDAAEAVPALLSGLAHPTWTHRHQIISVLGQIHARPEICVPNIAKALNDADPNVRDAAAKALARFGLDTNLQPLVHIILPETDRSDPPTNAVNK